MQKQSLQSFLAQSFHGLLASALIETSLSSLDSKSNFVHGCTVRLERCNSNGTEDLLGTKLS